MNDEVRDRPNRIPWPPIIYAVAAVIAYVIDRTIDLFPPKLAGLGATGWAIAAAGLAIAVAGVVQFKLSGTPVDPTGRATVLATGGIYRFTRNPMYLGGAVICLGLALALRSGGLLVVLPGVVIALDRLAIAREEAYLTRRFGAAYEGYCGRVRRWF